MNQHVSFPEPFSVERILLRLCELGAFKAPEIVNIGYGKGAFSGFAQYRYKPQPRAVIRKTRTPIFDAAGRARLVATVAQYLQQWNFSKFQFEADCLHGLRSHLCIRGHEWEDAQEEARAIVDDALGVIRAVRPTWAQGQREATTASGDCEWCSNPIPEDPLGRRRHHRFCSVPCAKNALVHKVFEKPKWHDATGMAAIRLIKEQQLPYYSCAHCEAEFQPSYRNVNQRYCSYVCSNLSRRLRDETECLQCRTQFFKQYVGNRDLCSARCAREYDALPKFKCWTCRKPFASVSKRPHFCGKTCREQWGSARRDDRLRACSSCNEVFAAGKRSDGFCSGLCRTKAKVRQALTSSFLCEAAQ